MAVVVVVAAVAAAVATVEAEAEAEVEAEAVASGGGMAHQQACMRCVALRTTLARSGHVCRTVSHTPPTALPPLPLPLPHLPTFSSALLWKPWEWRW